MLQSLHIENYALIRQADIDFGAGFVAITGETGAGKSILLGALGLLLGQRADLQVLARKEHKCVVEATFGIAGLGLEPLLAEADVDYDDTLVIRREILPSGKSRAFVADSPAQLPLLRQLGERLVDIHSQHQTLTLAQGPFQTALLDLMGASPIAQYRQAYTRYAALKRQLEELTADNARARRELDYLQFLFDELQGARLQSGEQEELEQEQQLLSHTEAIKEGLAMTAALCDADEAAALPLLSQARGTLARLTDYHPDIKALHSRLDSALIELRDIVAEAAHLDSTLAYSADRMQQVADRLDLIYKLERKHNTDSIDGLLAVMADLDARLQAISTTDRRIEQTMEEVDHAFAQVQTLADELTVCRTQAARRLEADIQQPLAQLGMKDARLLVQLQPAEHYGPTGHDGVAFMFNANLGGTPRPLAQVASGGEMSRLMLAVKSLVTAGSLLPTVVFDEIDTGVSGDISVAVGKIMASMAQTMQVIAITHLPQIAAMAGQHLKVYKEPDGEGATVSRIRQLQPTERVHELAVMLSQDPPSAAALQTAKELMQ